MLTFLAGDIMIWFMGQRHHTEIIDGCSFSLSFHLNKPAPETYFNDLKQTLAEVGMDESDRFFGDIQVAEIRYIHGCGILNKGADSFIVQTGGTSEEQFGGDEK
jgi:hypothetical protein